MGDHIDQMIRDSEAIAGSLADALLAMPDDLVYTLIERKGCFMMFVDVILKQQDVSVGAEAQVSRKMRGVKLQSEVTYQRTIVWCG